VTFASHVLLYQRVLKEISSEKCGLRSVYKEKFSN
jgi:hypothetical protein